MIQHPLWCDVLNDLADDRTNGTEWNDKEAIAYGCGFEAAMLFLVANPEAAMGAALQFRAYDRAEPVVFDPQHEPYWERMAEAVVADAERWSEV